ncbi:MAG: RCC1 repeat-containing protein, partial [Deltaproteobacteria bacterium]|nr:RCC1 repeat-containing protein [Deltaproteobacteria bacterium]
MRSGLLVGLSIVGFLLAGARDLDANTHLGTVWAWGAGMVGDGTITGRVIPVPVGSLLGVVEVAAGAGHSLAIKLDGTLWAWGQNLDGQLGDDTTTFKPTPVQVKGPGGVGVLGGVRGAAGGFHHSLAVTSNGAVWAWGENHWGQLGEGMTTARPRLTPVPVQVRDPNDPSRLVPLTDVTAVAAGQIHSLALKSDGTVWAWGLNAQGQLGVVGLTSVFTPTAVQVREDPRDPRRFLVGVTAIAAGPNHNLALKADGTVWAWGRNHNGELGIGARPRENTAMQVSTPAGPFIAVAAGGESGTGAGHSLALRNDGTVWAWGRNAFGQVGDGTTGTDRLAPVQVQMRDPTNPTQLVPLDRVRAIAAGSTYSLALRDDGTLWAWGAGPLGDATMTSRAVPGPVGRVAGGVKLAAGGAHSLALVFPRSGTPWSWGSNLEGQLGHGYFGGYSVLPAPVRNLGGIVAVAATSWHSLALKADGTVWAWGDNTE